MKSGGNLLERQGFRNALASIMAILIGMVVGLIILLISNPANAFPGFWAIATGGLLNRKNMGQVLYYATPIIMTGLSVGFAKKTGLFNIGASGQYVMGAFAAVYVGVKFTGLPAGIHCLVAILAAALVGALWGSVPGLLKAYCNINEVIACIMMNYIGMSMANLLVRKFIFDRAKNMSLQPVASAVLPKLGFDKIFVAGGAPSSANAGFVIAAVLGVVVWVILEKTKLGFELKACGYNRDAAKYAGINDKKNILLAMVFAGGLSGIGGALYYLSGAGSGIPVLDVLAAEGFNGIPVALLGMSNPIAIIFTGTFMAYLTQGGLSMQSYGFPTQIVDIMSAVIIYFAAFALFFSQLIGKIKLAPKAAAQEKVEADHQEFQDQTQQAEDGKGGEGQ